MPSSSETTVISQSLYIYIIIVCPLYAASLPSGTGFVNAAAAAAAVMLARVLHEATGKAKGISLLGVLHVYAPF